MKLRAVVSTGVLLGMILVFVAPAKAFEIVGHANGDRIWAGTTVTVEIDVGDISPLLGVLFVSSMRVSPSKIDGVFPYKWTFTIPANYYGPLTLRAIGRRFYPIPNPPRASVTLEVVRPEIQPISVLAYDLP